MCIFYSVCFEIDSQTELTSQTKNNFSQTKKKESPLALSFKTCQIVYTYDLNKPKVHYFFIPSVNKFIDITKEIFAPQS